MDTCITSTVVNLSVFSSLGGLSCMLQLRDVSHLETKSKRTIMNGPTTTTLS